MSTVNTSLSKATESFSKPSNAGFASISSEKFVQIMVSELTKQDPTKPQDTNQLLQQLSTLRNIESSTQLTTKLDQLVSQSQFSTAGALLNAKVVGKDENLNDISGIVKSIGQTASGTVLKLANGKIMPFKNLSEVRDPREDEPTTSTPSNTPSTAPLIAASGGRFTTADAPTGMGAGGPNYEALLRAIQQTVHAP